MTSSIREYTLSDQEQLSDLYGRSFGPGASEPFRNRWHWEFERPPALHRFANLIAERDQQVVAHVGRLSVRLAVGDRLVPAVFLSDLMADAERAGLLVLQLVARSLNEVPVVLHFGGKPEARQIFVRLGMKPRRIGEILLRVERPGGALAAFVRRRFGDRATAVRLLPSWLFRAAGALLIPACAVIYRWGSRLDSGRYAIATASDLDERFDDLWNAMRAECPVMCARDRAFLQWRYREAPMGNYTVLTATRADGTLGAASVLTSVPSGPARYGKFMECLYRDEDGLAAIINASLDAFHKMGVDMIVSIGLSQRARDMLRMVGFRPFGERPFSLKSKLGPDMDPLLDDPSNWYISPGDGDEDFGGNVDEV
jgi:hypothetical protein